MIRSNVDLPEPLRPSTPIFAPGKNDRLMSRRMTRFGGTTFDTRFIVKMYWATQTLACSLGKREPRIMGESRGLGDGRARLLC